MTYIATEPEAVDAVIYKDTSGISHITREDALAANVRIDARQLIRSALVSHMVDMPVSRQKVAETIVSVIESNPKLFAALVGYADAT